MDESKPSYYDKLVAFVDKIEFVEHLNCVKNEARKNGYIFDNKEVNGIDNDVDALNIYLILLCIDIFATLRKHEPFEKWILQCTDFNNSISFKEYMNNKVAEYERSFCVSSNFRAAILNSSVAKTLSENLHVLKCKSGEIKSNIDSIEVSSESNKIDSICGISEKHKA